MAETRMEVNCTTGVQTIHELTAEEIEQREIDRLTSERRHLVEKAEEEARNNAKLTAISKLSALGLTEEEIAAITN